MCACGGGGGSEGERERGRGREKSLVISHSKSGDQKVAELAQQTLTEFVDALMSSCFSSVQERLRREACLLESGTLVRALDKIGGKLQAMDKLLPSAGLSRLVTCTLYMNDIYHTKCEGQVHMIIYNCCKFACG